MPNPTSEIRPVIFVVGAGANRELRLPDGAELKGQIAELLNFRVDDWNHLERGDTRIFEAIHLVLEGRKAPRTAVDEYLAAAHRISAAMPQAISIDHFINAYRDYEPIEVCGKLAIVKAIASAERQSLLKLVSRDGKSQLEYAKLAQTWLTPFFQLLTENCTFIELPQRLRSIVLIVFNYDRCIEHFLLHAVQNYYGVDEAHAIEAMSDLTIVHPYGTVGSILTTGTKARFEFGGNPSSKQLAALSSGIRTFTETFDATSSEARAIHDATKSARAIVFLGFAFHRMNLDLLFPSPTRRGAVRKTAGTRRVFATAYGLSQTEMDFVQTDISRRWRLPDTSVSIKNSLTCFSLFAEYWRQLGLGGGYRDEPREPREKQPTTTPTAAHTGDS